MNMTESLKSHDTGAVDLSHVVFCAVEYLDRLLGKARKVVTKICPKKIKKRFCFSSKPSIPKGEKMPEFYPRVHYTSMKFNSKWLDKVSVKNELLRLDEDCEPSVHQICLKKMADGVGVNVNFLKQ